MTHDEFIVLKIHVLRMNALTAELIQLLPVELWCNKCQHMGMTSALFSFLPVLSVSLLFHFCGQAHNSSRTAFSLDFVTLETRNLLSCVMK
ncbi:hypothetical protein AVEN_211832-1 [Araneus ventricosus]|uniref:Uncharacterized protein n=1 Tax=Araneus ventricosus TaxID=182803 RepID=A0A4Y2HHT9_ARAVE|nr:hypothetical protein AVEN_211832-1 [Araneus ventricosus]